jgi:multisubunit Na+/H+ antiporter MnhF subunit
MNPWLASTVALTVSLFPCAAVCLRAPDPLERVVALEMGSAIVSLLLILLAEAMERSIFLDLGLTLALLSFGGGLVFARFFERWL